MSNRFDLSFKNKVVRMYLILLVPTVSVQTLLTLFTESPREIIAVIPALPLAIFFVWLYFHKRKQKKEQAVT